MTRATLLQSPLHRVPTLWSLYRPLLRAARLAPLDADERNAIERYVKEEFKRSRKIANVERVAQSWREGETLLHQLESSHASSSHVSRLRELASHLVSRRRVPSHPPRPPNQNPPQRSNRAQPRPLPSIMHSTQFNPPMPRLDPQPLATTMMIFNRRRASQKRYDRVAQAKELVADVDEEARFEARILGRTKTAVGRELGWEWKDWIKDARRKEIKEQARNNASFRTLASRAFRSPASSSPRPLVAVTHRARAQPVRRHVVPSLRTLASSAAQHGPVKDFKLADIGEGITECEIVKWLVEPGDTIQEFDPVAEVTSDKASVEITSPFTGRIKSLAGEPGQMLKVGTTLCQIEIEGDEPTPSPSSASASTSTPPQSSNSVRSGGRAVKQFKLADIGEGITECEVVKWLVSPGDTVAEFDPVCEVTSDKASVEITSPFAGTVKSLAGGVGDMLKVGSTLCEIEVEASEGDGAVEPVPDTTSASDGQISSNDDPHPVRPDPSHGAVSVLATPATRRFARELNVDLTRVTPTGRDGRVTKGDVYEYSKGKASNSTPFVPFERPPAPSSSRAAPSPSTPIGSSSGPDVHRSTTASDPIVLNATRRAMYRAMSASLQIPHFAYSDTIDVTLLERLRLSLNSSVPLRFRKTLKSSDEVELERAKQWGENAATDRVDESQRFDRITLLPLLVKALSTAMHDHPLFSCTLNPSTTTAGSEPTLTRRLSHDISVAVSSPSPSGGLFTPVLRSVESASIFSVAASLTHVQSFLSSSTPKFPASYQGTGTITLSNIGAIGGRTTHPVIPPTGQLAIGAMGRVRVEPRLVKGQEEERAKRVAKGLEDGGDAPWKVEPRMVMDVTFTADHRIAEGVELARLVETWKSIIEDPNRLVGW
ncbi:hypothetical protein JCM10212_003869 [Sporobolomyces blumeae]